MAYADSYRSTERHAFAGEFSCVDGHGLQASPSGRIAPDATAWQLRQAAASDLTEARRYYLITLLVATSTLGLHLFRLVG